MTWPFSIDRVILVLAIAASVQQSNVAPYLGPAFLACLLLKGEKAGHKSPKGRLNG